MPWKEACTLNLAARTRRGRRVYNLPYPPVVPWRGRAGGLRAGGKPVIAGALFVSQKANAFG